MLSPVDRLATCPKDGLPADLCRDNTTTLEDDPAAQVLVLGDSFLRIYEQDEPGAAGFIAHLARELRQPLASVVNDGGASTLVRQELYRRPTLLQHKRVVVWEFVDRDIRFGIEGWQQVPLLNAGQFSVFFSGFQFQFSSFAVFSFSTSFHFFSFDECRWMMDLGVCDRLVLECAAARYC